MKVVIYNDTYVENRVQFGPELVMETFKEQLDRVGIELIGTVPVSNRKPRHRIMESADLVICNGEGSFHHNRRNDIAEVSNYYPSILINTVFQDNACDTSKFLFKSARESMSAQALSCAMIPDIIFTNKRLLNTSVSKNAAGTGHIRHWDHIKSMQPASDFLLKVVNYSSVTSESFHGLIVATVLSQNIAKVLPGNTWKNESLMKDIEDFPDYIQMATTKINNLFERLWDFK